MRSKLLPVVLPNQCSAPSLGQADCSRKAPGFVAARARTGAAYPPSIVLLILVPAHAVSNSCCGVPVLTHGCATADRKLQHINKKGRPVSQCQHCRSMRKSRSSHIKCDCGEKS